MTRRAPWRDLLRLGRASERRAEAGRIRFAALACSTAALALALASFAAVHATYEGRAAREAARSPRLLPGPDLTGDGLWAASLDEVHRRQFLVVAVTPLTHDAALPPGLDRWPEPGEAMLSPGLVEAGAREGITTRFGRYAGTIGEDGLATPGELLAYVRPPAAPGRAAVGMPFSGYGSPGGLASLDGRNVKPESWFQAMMAGLLLLPALVLVAVAVRTGAHRRDRRTRLIAVLGGSARDRALIALGECAGALAAGAAIAVLPIAGVMVSDYRIPYVRYVLSAADMRGAGWPLAGAVLAAVAVVAAAAVGAGLSARGERADRGRWAGARMQRWAVLCPVTVFAAVRGPGLLPYHSVAWAYANWFGAGAALATLPFAVAALTTACGRGLVRAGRSRGRASWVIAGRRATVYPGATVRLVSGVAVGLGLLVQVMAWFGHFDSEARDARAVQAQTGASVLVVQLQGRSLGERLPAFVAAMPTPVETVAMVSPEDPSKDGLALRGSCAALSILHLGCTGSPVPVPLEDVADPRTRALLSLNGYGTDRLTVQRGDAIATAGRQAAPVLLLVSADGTALPLFDAKRIAYREIGGGVRVDTIAGAWLTGAGLNALQGRWISLVGALGVAVLALTAGIGGLAEFLRSGRALSPLAVLSGNRAVFYGTAALSVLAPLVSAGLGGELLALWLALPQTQGGAAAAPDWFLAACAAAVVVLGLVMWAWGSTVAVARATAWRPGAG